MSLEPLPATARAPVPWVNGGGITREVARSVGPSGSGFRWRISIADVAADGPFSPFPGYERVITVLRGHGMELTVDGTRHVIDAAYQPFRFSGSAHTECRLIRGPVVDLNVIAAPRQDVNVTIVRLARTLQVAVATTAVVVMLQGSAMVRAAVGTVALMPFDATLACGERSVSVQPQPGAIAVMAVINLPEPEHPPVT